MKCIILCAGFATRLYPLTKNVPKPLLNVGKKTIIDSIISKISSIKEIKEIYIITNDVFFNQFNQWKEHQKNKSSIHILNDGVKNNETRLGTVGDLNFVMQNAKINDDVMIIGGDNLFEFSLKDFLTYFKEKSASVIALHDLKNPAQLAKKFGVAVIDKNHKIIDFQEKPEHPKSTLAATLCYVLKKESLHKLPAYIKDNKGDNAGSFIEWLIKSENVYGFTFTEAWFDIGSHEALAEARKIYESKE